jgi:hypothetical protein
MLINPLITTNLKVRLKAVKRTMSDRYRLRGFTPTFKWAHPRNRSPSKNRRRIADGRSKPDLGKVPVENKTPNASSASLIPTKDPSSLPMRMSGMWLWQRLLVALILFPVGFFVVFWSSTFLLAQWDEAWRPAWMGDGVGAEAIVILPADGPPGFSAELVPFSMVKDFAARHPESTFLIPPSQQGTDQQGANQHGQQRDTLRQKEVEEQLRPKLASLSLDVKQLPGGAQQISIEDMDRTDDSHGTRYGRPRCDGRRVGGYRLVVPAQWDRAGLCSGLVHLSVAQRSPRRCDG